VLKAASGIFIFSMKKDSSIELGAKHQGGEYQGDYK
jgi:hypothetical protein